MKYFIPCSYGELVDKYTILKIKQNKSIEFKKEISNEIDLLKEYIDTNEPLIDELYKINQRLWILEDTIRLKSQKKEFDQRYLECAESIHVTNDKRFEIKNKLNQKYNSDIKEYKMYSSFQKEYTTALKYFENGDFQQCFLLLTKIIEKGKADTHVYYSYETCCSTLGIDNIHAEHLKEAFHFTFTPEEILHFNKIYCFYLLRNKKYIEAGDYIRYLQPVTVTGQFNISPENMSFFKEGDSGKTLLVYMSGGLGDKIMYSRFLKKVAEQWSSNFIVFLVDDCLYWMFENVYPQNTNVIKYSLRHFLNHFDYHCNVSMLMVYLGISYNDIYIDYYLKTTKTTRDNTIVINWKGNAENVNEKNNRSMPLVQLISLFKIKNIRWVTVQKNITNDEHKLLKKYNVEILNVDNGENAFQDTLELFKTVKLVITTDTSLAHVAGTSDTPCCVMLTTGCDWRWTQDTITNWYPNVKLVRQKNMNWSNVIEEIKNIVSN